MKYWVLRHLNLVLFWRMLRHSRDLRHLRVSFGTWFIFWSAAFSCLSFCTRCLIRDILIRIAVDSSVEILADNQEDSGEFSRTFIKSSTLTKQRVDLKSKVVWSKTEKPWNKNTWITWNDDICLLLCAICLLMYSLLIGWWYL